MLRNKMGLWWTIILRCYFNVFFGVICFLDVSHFSHIVDTDKVELVKEIIVNLAQDVESNQVGMRGSHTVSLESFLRKDQVTKPVGNFTDLRQRMVN